MDPLELLHLLGLEVLLVLRQLVNLLLVLAQFLCLLFLYLLEVAGEVLCGLGKLLGDLVLLDALRLIYRGCLLCYFALQNTLSDLDGSLHLIFVTEGPGLRRHLSLLPWDLVFEYLLGSQLCWFLPWPRLCLPGRRWRDLKSHVLACLVDHLSTSCVMRVLDGLLW